jgi:hypothetical protein
MWRSLNLLIYHWWLYLVVADISANVYWRTPFIPLFDHRQFVQFLVLQCDVVSTLPVAHNISGKYVLSEVWVCPLNEMDRHVYTRTHLGHFLNPGDVVWGVDFARSNLNDEHFDKLKTSDVPEVVNDLFIGDINARCSVITLTPAMIMNLPLLSCKITVKAISCIVLTYKVIIMFCRFRCYYNKNYSWCVEISICTLLHSCVSNKIVIE